MTSALLWLADIAPDVDTNNSTDKKNRFIGVASSHVSASLFADASNYNLAVAYYAAHLLTLTARDAHSRGSLSSEKEDSLTRSYGGASSDELNTTQYLDNFNRMIKARQPLFFTTCGN